MSAQVNLERKNTERIFARGFTVLGSVFWIAAGFAGPMIYKGQDAVQAFLSQGMYPLAFSIGVLLLGWFYERFTALILALGALGTIAWGLIWGGWEPFVWGIVLAFFVAPTVVAAVLFYLAGDVVTTEEPVTSATA
jgi:hypothetical protein